MISGRYVSCRYLLAIKGQSCGKRHPKCLSRARVRGHLPVNGSSIVQISEDTASRRLTKVSIVFRSQPNFFLHEAQGYKLANAVLMFKLMISSVVLLHNSGSLLRLIPIPYINPNAKILLLIKVESDLGLLMSTSSLAQLTDADISMLACSSS